MHHIPRYQMLGDYSFDQIIEEARSHGARVEHPYWGSNDIAQITFDDDVSEDEHFKAKKPLASGCCAGFGILLHRDGHFFGSFHDWGVS